MLASTGYEHQIRTSRRSLLAIVAIAATFVIVFGPHFAAPALGTDSSNESSNVLAATVSERDHCKRSMREALGEGRFSDPAHENSSIEQPPPAVAPEIRVNIGPGEGRLEPPIFASQSATGKAPSLRFVHGRPVGPGEGLIDLSFRSAMHAITHHDGRPIGPGEGRR
jgi:hypothetical protein